MGSLNRKRDFVTRPLSNLLPGDVIVTKLMSTNVMSEQGSHVSHIVELHLSPFCASAIPATRSKECEIDEQYRKSLTTMGLLHRKKDLHPLGSFPVAPEPSEKPSECPAIEVAPSSFDVNSIFTTPPSMVSHISGSDGSSDEEDFLLTQNEGDDSDEEDEDDDDFSSFEGDNDEDDEADDLTLLHAQHIPMPQPSLPPASPRSKTSMLKGIRKSIGRIKKGVFWRYVPRKQATRRAIQRDDDTYSKPEFTSVDSFNLTRLERLRIHWEEWMQPRRKRVNHLVYHAAEDITEDEVHSTSESSSESSSSTLSENKEALKLLKVYPFTCASF
jgi:hypothetical protein